MPKRLSLQIVFYQLTFWLGGIILLPWLPWLYWKGTQLRHRLGPAQPAAGDPSGFIPSQALPGAKPFRILIIGDSLVAGVGAPTLQEALAGQVALALHQHTRQSIHWKARGKSGYTSHDLVHQLLPALSPHEEFDAIVISVGVNDCTHAVSPRQWHRNMNTLFAHLEQRYGNVTTVLLRIPPLALFPAFSPPLSYILGGMAYLLNRITLNIAPHYPQVKLPFFALPDSWEGFFAADGVHPGPLGYQLIAKGVAACFPAFEEDSAAKA